MSAKCCPETTMDKKNLIGGLDKWDVESALRTLRDADKVKADSKKMKAVNILAKQEVSALEKIAGNKDGGLGTEN